MNEANKLLPKSAGEIFTEALEGKKRRRFTADEGKWRQLALSFRLADLEENWTQAAGEALARRSRPYSCDASEGILKIGVNVTDQTVLASVRFRKQQLERKLTVFFGVETKCEFRIGPTGHSSTAKPALPEYMRRPPVVLEEEAVTKEKDFFAEGGLSEELSEKLARIKLSLEKLDKRTG